MGGARRVVPVNLIDLSLQGGGTSSLDIAVDDEPSSTPGNDGKAMKNGLDVVGVDPADLGHHPHLVMMAKQ